MAEHVMQIAFRMLNAFAKRAMGANSVRSTKDQKLQLQPLPKLQSHCHIRNKIEYIFNLLELSRVIY
jgi:hypothetical protein